jgi:transcriptional regulator with AAA-type ATPase domain/transcriptional regulatory protein LevR
MVKDQVKQIIGQEDKKNPLTDEQIAQRLGLRRDEVTLLRHQLNIPDSRKRRLPILRAEIAAMLKKNPHISDRELTSQLQSSGIDVSRFTVLNIRKELQALATAGDASRPPQASGGQGAERTLTFAGMIGRDGTLKAAMQQARAAVLYPPNGLHTLLFGPTGVGKSRMAEAMYHFAVERQIMSKYAPFVVFNCADYAKNPQLLLAQLFGYVKGAFTGADQEKAGLVDRANGGVLFLDEIHRLPPEGQENLFYLIDKNLYRRLGEVDFQRRANLLIIGATTESPESSLLLTLRRRIPMMIELPPLSEWSEGERLELVFHFLSEESSRIGRSLKVNREVALALIRYECPGNTGQLHSDIRVLLARALLKNMGAKEQDQVEVDRHDLPPSVAGSYSAEAAGFDSALLKKEWYVFIPGQQANPMEAEGQAEQPIALLYDWIVERHRSLKEQGQNEELIQLIINKELETRLGAVSEQHEARLQQLVRLVGEKIVQTVEQMLWIAEKHLTLDHQKITYALAIHLKGILDRQQAGEASAASGEGVLNKDSVEFSVAKEMSKVVQAFWGINLSDEEIGFLAMYLSQCRTYTQPRKLIGVVVASYGLVGKSMVDVAHRLFAKRHAIAVELHWDDEVKQTVGRIGEAVQKADQGAGVILLADMGAQFLQEVEWQELYGVRVKVIPSLTTTLVVEVLRKCLYSEIPLDQLAAAGGEAVLAEADWPAKQAKPKAIIAVCLTGEGAARRLGALLQESLGEKGKRLTYLIGSSLSIRKKYQEWTRQYDILAVVGTVDPMLDGIPFVSFKEIVDESGLAFLNRLLLVQGGIETGLALNQPLHLQDLLSAELSFESLPAVSKEQVIEHLADKLVQAGRVQQKYKEKVWERERMGPTHIAGIAAIPHADPTYTIKPAVAIARLSQPVEWEAGVWVRFVFMLAIDENCQMAVEELYEAITRPDFIQSAQQQETTTITSLLEVLQWKNK